MKANKNARPSEFKFSKQGALTIGDTVKTYNEKKAVVLYTMDNGAWIETDKGRFHFTMVRKVTERKRFGGTPNNAARGEFEKNSLY
jgi:hypothetical protein